MSHIDPTYAFYTVADSNYFVGVVALINSLRLVGHHEPIYVTDCGLSESHRRRLAEHVTLVTGAPVDAPHLAKMVAPAAHPADVMVLIDADIIVTRPLTALVDLARPGKVVGFTDQVANRFDERWAQLLGLHEVRRQPYVNAGLVASARAIAVTLFGEVANGSLQIDVGRTQIADGASEDPFFYLDQDVFNAVLGTYPVERLEVLDHRLAPFPPFPGVRVIDEATLRCAYEDGVEPYALHHVRRKPWNALTRWNIYSRLLSRLLLWPDVAISLAPEELPLRLRSGATAWLEKRRSDGISSLAGMRGRLGLRRKLAGKVRGRKPRSP